MGYNDNTVTIVGNLTDDFELRFTGKGKPVASSRVAHNRGKDDDSPTFVGIVAFDDFAENVAESLHKGDRVVVIGRLQVRSYEKNDGTVGYSTEIVADEVAPSLRWARATVTKARSNGNTRQQTVPAGGDASAAAQIGF